MSSTRQAVVRGPSLTGWGKRPDFTPAHHVDFETGIGPRGARIDTRRTKPVSGNALGCDTMGLHSMANEGVVSGAGRFVTERA